MDFETRDGRLHFVPPRLSIGYSDMRTMFKRTTITVDGRIVRDVLLFDCGYIVVDLDGSESRWDR